MKGNSSILRGLHRVLAFAMILLCILALCGPALATENDPSYGICIDLAFSDSESVEHGVADYQANVFLVQNADGMFLIAEYNQDTGSYIMIGKTANEKEATRFHCGRNPDAPSFLRINGLPADGYTIIMTDITDSFVLLKDEMEVVISGDTAMVNGREVTMDSLNVPITVFITHGYRLPGPNPYAYSMPYIGYCVIIAASLVIVIMLRSPVKDDGKEVDGSTSEEANQNEHT